ncbi:flagellar biosynthetic protein FliR [Limimaricola hongkongensis]|uniref:Flagellar biosynthesis protein FliR n=1 Tax=Limimaricola hongkongensis DSM 17492 TaxID=1122180 RepID=A0A017HIP7_9RHOB|nr:flagellar biosynthetic protein FliR [Limimaricola hongkongensis]EYD73644.1 Flagellar biosynthesis protein FliR [Limimaricola hongkongensis DSM 17492]
MDLAEILVGQALSAGLVFARLGAALMFLPGFGEQAIPPRHRLLFALMLSAALAPLVPVEGAARIAPVPLLAMLAVEITIGLWIGTTARILFSALSFAGYQLGMVAGLSNAFAPATGSFEGSTLLASVLMMAGVALIFVTELHHLMIRALVDSYVLFPPGQLMLGDLAQQVVRAVAQSFYLGVSLAAPFYVLSLVLNLGMGLANRAMPSLPVFFVAAPILIATGLLGLVLAGPAMLAGTAQALADWFNGFRF